jgi:peptide/nickel transport system permease protein
MTTPTPPPGGSGMADALAAHEVPGGHDPAIGLPEVLPDGSEPPRFAPTRVKPSQKRSQIRDIWRRYRRNKIALVGLGIVTILLLIAILEPILTPYDPKQQNLANTNGVPDADHLIGTDGLGRDLFSGILFGTRLAVIVGFSTMLLTLFLGVALGAISGYKGKGWDTLIMRITDIFLAFPYLIGAILIVRIFGSGITTVIVALALLGWSTSARLMRGQVLSLREAEYVEAARSIGASDTRIVIKHILPNAISPVLIYSFTSIGVAVVAMASLAFLGIGVPADTPEWGQLISQALPYLRISGYSHLWIWPSVAIVITVLGFAFVADGLRDSLDPKLR